MSSSNSNPGARFRELLKQGPVIIPGVFNALTARMAQRAGFEAVYQSGAALSAGLSAVPDVGLITREEFVEQGRYLAQAVTVPVLSDADTGFGDETDVAETVRQYEQAGLAGLHLEDQQFPKRCGHLGGKTVVSSEEMVSKVKAAVAAKENRDFVIIARTDARAVEGLDAAIARAGAYIEAGADMIFPEAMETPEEFSRFAEKVSSPLLANMTEFGKSPPLTVAQLGEMGYAAVLFPVTMFRVAMKSVENALSQLAAEGTQQNFLDQMQTRAELYDLLNYDASP